jgi:hypothetical protein
MAYKPQVIGNTKGLRPEVIEKLEEISKNTGKPVTVTPEGAFRKIKPGETSAHNYGLAVDIKIPGYNTEQIADELRKVGFTGIGCYYDNDGTPRMFAHGDIRGHDAAKGTPFGRGTAHGGPAHWVRVYRDSSRKTWDDYKNKEEWQQKRGTKPSPPKEKVKPTVNVKMNLLAGLIAGLIAALVIVIVFWSQGFFGGGGGGGTGGYDGTYNCNVTTVTPIGTTSLPGTFTVVNGYVSDPGGTFIGTVNANGYFTGTTIVSPGSPQMTMTGQFSTTGNFTLYGSSGNTSQTVVAHKVS